MSVDEPIEEYRGELGVFRRYERFLVVEPAETIGREPDRFYAEVSALAAAYTRPFGYIGNRVNRNAGDASLMVRGRREFPLWRAFALVAYSGPAERFFPMEARALKGMPCELFRDLEPAMEWMDATIAEIRGVQGERARK